MDYLPIAMKLKNRRAIVVGGGLVASRKVQSLLDSGALVTVISPELENSLKELEKSGEITWVNRLVSRSDIKDAYIVITATNDSEVNNNVASWARSRGIYVNAVDKPLISDFISPAVLRKDKAIIAVYTDGKDPVLSRDLKNYLGEKWDDFLSYRDRL